MKQHPEINFVSVHLVAIKINAKWLIITSINQVKLLKIKKCTVMIFQCGSISSSNIVIL